MLLGIGLCCAVLTQPMLLLGLLFWFIRLVPNYLAYMSENFGNEIWSQMNGRLWHYHCDYDAMWAEFTTSAAPTPPQQPPAG